MVNIDYSKQPRAFISLQSSLFWWNVQCKVENKHNISLLTHHSENLKYCVTPESMCSSTRLLFKTYSVFIIYMQQWYFPTHDQLCVISLSRSMACRGKVYSSSANTIVYGVIVYICRSVTSYGTAADTVHLWRVRLRVDTPHVVWTHA